MLLEKVSVSCPVNEESDNMWLPALNRRDFVIWNTHFLLLISQLKESNLVLLWEYFHIERNIAGHR